MLKINLDARERRVYSLPMPATRNAVPVALTPAEIAARFDADELARKARIVRADERHAARMQASARSSHSATCIIVIALCDDGLASIDVFTGATAQADAVEYARCMREDGDGERQFAVKRLHGARATAMLAVAKGENFERINAYRAA